MAVECPSELATHGPPPQVLKSLKGVCPAKGGLDCCPVGSPRNRLSRILWREQSAILPSRVAPGLYVGAQGLPGRGFTPGLSFCPSTELSSLQS